MAEEMRLAYLHAQAGTLQSVLFEEPEGEYFTGHTPNYVKVYVKEENLHNELREVTLLEPFRDGMLGVLAKN